MGYKELMQTVTKDQAIQFIMIMRRRFTVQTRLSEFPILVSEVYNQVTNTIGSNMNSGTANAVVTRMERKSKLEL